MAQIGSRIATLRLTAIALVILLLAPPYAHAQKPALAGALDGQLLEAVQNDNRATVMRLLDSGASIEAADANGETPLLVAAENGDAIMVKLLLERGASIHAQDRSGETALVKAARYPNPENMAMLLGRMPTLAEKNQALAVAAQGGPLVINIHAAAGDEKFDETEETSDRVNAPYAEVARLLLDAGADIEAKDEAGNTPLINAASHGNTLVLRLLLARGADINAADPEGGTALMAAACDCGEIDKPDTQASLQFLLEKGGALEAKDKDGRTALMAAAISGHSAQAGLLLQAGANVNAADRNGNTALMLAAEGSAIPTEDAVKTLLEHGALVNARNKAEQTALMLAAAGQSYDPESMIQLLLRWGADPSLKDAQGNTALAMAGKSGRAGAIQILKNIAARQ